MSKLLIPNTTQMPNVLLDRLMPLLPVAPLKTLLAIVRFTYGFQKHSDKIGFKQLAKATGLSRRSAIRAVEFLGGLIRIKPGGPGKGANEYSLNLDITDAQLKPLKVKASGDAADTSDATGTSVILSTGVVTPLALSQTNNPKPKQTGAKAPTSSHHRKKRYVAPDPAQLEAFARFYEAYPRHVSKQDALKAWIELAPGLELIAEIMAGVERYAEAVRDTDPKYVKHPGPWLNARRWEDEPAGGNGNAEDPEYRKRTFINA